MKANRAFVLCLLLSVSQLARGDDGDEERARFFRPSPGFWSFDIQLSNAFSDNILENQEELDSYGMAVGGVLRGEKRSGSHLFRFAYNLDLRSFTATDRRDRSTHNLAVMFFEQIGPKVNAGVIGGYSLRSFTEDRQLANHYNVWSQIEYRANRWFRVGGHGALRWTRLEDTLRDEQVLLIGGEVGGRIGRSSVWELGYRRENNDAGNSYRRFDRSRWWAGYGVRLGARDTVEIEVEQRRRRFRDLRVRADGGEPLRRELLWTPSVSWVHRFDQGRLLRVSYVLRKRRSNDPTKAFEAHRLQATFRVPLLGRSRRRQPGRGGTTPWPRPPNGAVGSDTNVLEMIRLYSEHEDLIPPDGGSFTVGSHWKELLAAQGTPTNVSKKQVFNEERWFYGSSSVVLRNGVVTSWHDTGNLHAEAPPPEPEPTPRIEVKRPAIGSRRASLSAVAVRNRRDSAVEAESVDRHDLSDKSSPADPRRVDESLAGAVKRLTKTEIVLKDGTRLPGILKRFEDGLAHIILFLDDRKTVLTTLPEDLVDKEATQGGADP